MKTPKWLIRLIEILLAVHTWIHVVEFGTAIYEEAYITASIAMIGILTFVGAAIFLEQGHSHQHGGKHE